MEEREDPRYRGTFLPPSNVPPDGPSFVLVKREDDGNFQHTSPFAIARALDSICGGSVLNAKAIRSGSLLVHVRNKTQATQLLACTRFLDYPVSVQLADRLNSIEGVITCDALVYSTDDEILHELRSQGVIGVYRLPSRNPDNPNPTVKLTFAGKTLPAALYCGYLAVEVRPWVAGRARCTRCWAYGHSTRLCRRKIQTCGRCGQGGHGMTQCPAGYTSCPCCGGPHCATDKECSKVKEQRREHRQRQREAAYRHREEHFLRSRPGNHAASWPTLTETIPATQTTRRSREQQHPPSSTATQAAAQDRSSLPPHHDHDQNSDTQQESSPAASHSPDAHNTESDETEEPTAPRPGHASDTQNITCNHGSLPQPMGDLPPPHI